MKKIKTAELIGPALDWAVAKCEGHAAHYYGGVVRTNMRDRFGPECHYSTDWKQGGPIIEREHIELKYLGYDRPPYWGATKFVPSKYERRIGIGPTSLVAAMRAYVTAKLGDEIDVPENLL